MPFIGIYFHGFSINCQMFLVFIRPFRQGAIEIRHDPPALIRITLTSPRSIYLSEVRLWSCAAMWAEKQLPMKDPARVTDFTLNPALPGYQQAFRKTLNRENETDESFSSPESGS